MRINVKADIKQVTRHLTSLQRKQIPFAVSKGLNATAKQVIEEEKREAARAFEAPTRFTLSGFRMIPSKKRNWVATVHILPKQYEYLKYEIDGGIRLPHRRAIAIPVNARTNASGNLPRGKVARLAARKDTFSGTPRGHARAKPGIYQRPSNRDATIGGKSITMLVGYRKTARYSKLFRYYTTARRTVKTNIRINLSKALAQAIRTAK